MYIIQSQRRMLFQFKIFIFFFVTLTTVFSATNKEGWSMKTGEVFNEKSKITVAKSSEEILMPPSFWHEYTPFGNRRTAHIGRQIRFPIRNKPPSHRLPLWNEDAFINDYSEY
nr:uncharacterized protein LOC111416628 [Onthophagus taurus]